MILPRIWEIDFCRGLAIMLMVIFHIVVDLKDFFSYPIEYLTGFWFYIGKLSAVLFIFIAGLSATLSRKTLKHGTQIFLWALLITVITFFYNPVTYIRFGILHFLGFSIASYPLIASLRPLWAAVISLILITFGFLYTPLLITSPYLFAFGLITDTFTTLDYYPIIPWYGVFLLGVAAGKTVYRRHESLFTAAPVFTPIVLLGRHSLAVYLIHQPILLLVCQVLFSRFSP